MMTGAIVKAWKIVKPHVPLIKFRKGGTNRGQVPEPAPAPANPGGKTAPGITTTSLPVIEDWQLPPKYRRQLIDEKEIEIINSGGAY